MRRHDIRLKIDIIQELPWCLTCCCHGALHIVPTDSLISLKILAGMDVLFILKDLNFPHTHNGSRIISCFPPARTKYMYSHRKFIKEHNWSKLVGNAYTQHPAFIFQGRGVLWGLSYFPWETFIESLLRAKLARVAIYLPKNSYHPTLMEGSCSPHMLIQIWISYYLICQ